MKLCSLIFLEVKELRCVMYDAAFIILLLWHFKKRRIMFLCSSGTAKILWL
jgi:hypothetical protein